MSRLAAVAVAGDVGGVADVVADAVAGSRVAAAASARGKSIIRRMYSDRPAPPTDKRSR